MNFGHSTIRLTVLAGPLEADGQVRVSLIGELDHDEAGRLRDAVSDTVERLAPRHVTLDAAELTFLDSAGIRALLECRDLAEKAGASLSVAEVSPIVFQVLRVTELVDYLAVTRASLPVANGAGAERTE
ncbi:STAS domain-containing protein [Actinoplanes sp. NPDC026670]|uniref:STAS domain-containing protein n=1 Tax=Actinoplanes sp. NPDC026670 TaxID=3154700 RepID=UPI0033F71235